MAWQDPRVRAMAQFLLVDSAPDPSFPQGSIGYWSTFQTGLEYLDGAHKPSFDAYRLPIFVPTPSFHSGAIGARVGDAATGAERHDPAGPDPVELGRRPATGRSPRSAPAIRAGS